MAQAEPEERPKELEWRSQYPTRARAQIWIEGGLLFFLIAAAVSSLILVWWFDVPWISIEDTARRDEFRQFTVATLAGGLGGLAFSMKWLYHSVAKKIWKEDRIFWRFFTPIISAIFAGAFFAVLKSGLLNIEIESDTETFAAGFGFMVGYFSDHAAKKLREVADTLFGKPDDTETP